MIANGLHRGVPMWQYLGLEAMGSSHLAALATSPLHYQHLLSRPERETESTNLGSAVHTAVLEPEQFDALYVTEPDPEKVAPGYEKPRATKAFKEARKALEATGRQVIKFEVADRIGEMADAVRANPLVAKLLAKAPEREITMIWDRDGRRCRGRADMLGDIVLGDLKTTRSLPRFSPFEITTFRYHLQLAHYVDGLRRLGRDIKHVYLVAVESSPPYDVAVYEMDEAIAFGALELDELMARLLECERSNAWPGMFPTMQVGHITDRYAAEIAVEAEEVA